MTRSMFDMGFRSSWGLQPAPAPALGSFISNLEDWWKSHSGDAKDIIDRTKAPVSTTPLPVAPAAPATIFGLPQQTVIIGGSILLGGAVLVAVLAGSN